MKLNLIKHRKIYLWIPVALMAVSLAAILFKGLNYGIDFSGGNLFQVTFEKPVTLTEVNESLDKIAGEIPQLNATSRKVQLSEERVVILRSQEITEDEKDKVLENLRSIGNYSIDKIEKVGASIGEELKFAAIWSLVVGAVLIVLYITFRFEFFFAVAAVICLLHDVIIACGGISLLGYEVNNPFIAAILTMVGYSINDTIVIFDRVRENLTARRRLRLSTEQILETSVNQCVRRSLNTSLTTMFAVLALLIFGGDSLKSFVVALLIGVVVGTYSSMFLATPLVYIMTKNRNSLEKFDEKEKEEEEKILV